MDTHTGKRDHARMEVEVGVVQPQAKECLESLGVGSSRKDSPLEPLEVSVGHLDFGLLASKEREHF